MITKLVQSGNNLSVTDTNAGFLVEDFFLNSTNDVLGKLPNGSDLTWIEAKIAFADQLINDANALTLQFPDFQVSFDSLDQTDLIQNIQQSILELPEVITLAVYNDISFLGNWTNTVWDEVGTFGQNGLPWGTDENKGEPTRDGNNVLLEDQVNNDGVLPDSEVDMSQARLFTTNEDVVDFNTVAPGSYREGTQFYGDAGNDTVILANVETMSTHGWTAFENSRGDIGNAFSAGAGDDVVYGSDDVDTIYGNTGNDQIFGGKGDDELHGMEGNDVIYGGEGDDLIIGHTGNDSLYGNEGDDEIHGDQGDDYIEGNLGNDVIFGGKGNDVLFGNGPNTDAALVEVRTPFSGEAGSLSSTNDMKALWENSDVKFYSLEFGETINDTLDMDNLLFDKNGIGIKEQDEANDAIGKQITYNSKTGESQSLVLEFPEGTNKALVTFSNLFENEGSFTEVGKYQVYDKDMILLGSGEFKSEENKNVGVVDIDVGNNFKYIQLSALPYEGEGKERAGDSSDYFVRHVSYEGEIVELQEPVEENDNDHVFGGEGNDIVYGNGGDDYVAGGLGEDIVYGGSGNDKGVADLTDGKLNEYHGDRGYDILDLQLTEQQLADIDIIKDIMALKKFLADTSDITKDNVTGETQYFEKLNLKASTWEELKVNGKDFNPDTTIEKQHVFSIEVFESEAGYQNSFGFFDSSNQGKLIYANVKEAVGKEPVVIEVDDPKSVDFFILPNGNNRHDVNDMDDVSVNENTGEIVVGSETLKMGTQAYFSDPEKNLNNEIRVVDNDAQGTLNWEDLPNLGDKDFDDVNVQATLETTLTGSDFDDMFEFETSADLYVSKTWVDGGAGNDTIDLTGAGSWTISDINGVIDPNTFAGQEVHILFDNGDELNLKDVENIVW